MLLCGALVGQASENTFERRLSHWTSDATADDELSGQHVLIYWFSASLLAYKFQTVTALILAELILRNGKKRYELWLRGVMTAPMAILDLTYIGRVMNRLSKEWIERYSLTAVHADCFPFPPRTLSASALVSI